MVGEEIELRFDEILVLDVVISMSINMFTCIYLSFICPEITYFIISFSLLIITLFTYLIFREKLLKSNILRNLIPLDTSKNLFFLIITFLIGFLLTTRIIPVNYWHGWDPWVNPPIAYEILNKGLNPFELNNIYQSLLISTSGFQYFIAAVRSVTGISLYAINRFGGPFLAGLISIITYLIIRRLEGLGSGLLASFFLFLNPFIVIRFSQTLRENFSFIFLLIIFLISYIRKIKYNNSNPYNLFYLSLICLLLSAVLVTHQLTPIIIYSFLSIELFFFISKNRNEEALELFLSFIFSAILSLPYLGKILLSLKWVISNQIFLEIQGRTNFNILKINLFIILISLLIFSFFYTKFNKLNFKFIKKRTIFLLIIIALIMGAFNSIIFPKSFEVMGSYNPPIKLKNFSISIIPMALIGMISSLYHPISNSILFISLIILFLFNLTNINIAFPLYRLTIYASWLLSYGAVKGLKTIYNLINNLEKQSLRINEKIILRNLKPYIITCSIILIASPIIIYDFNSLNRTWSYHNQEDTDSALRFVSLLKEKDLVIPQVWTLNLLRYVGIDLSKVIRDEELYSITDPQDFSKFILLNHPNASRALIFIINRWIGYSSYPTPQLDMLNKYATKQQIGSVVFYVFELPFELEESESLISPIIFKKPKGDQWLFINITKFDLRKVDALKIEIMNNDDISKSFFIQLSDIYGNKTEKFIFKLSTGHSSYQISINEIKDKFDLIKIERLIICFSWWDRSEIDLIINSITTISRI